MKPSLRFRLILGTTVGTLAVFALAAGVLYGVIHHSLVGDFHTALASEAHTLAAVTEQGRHGVKVELEPEVFDASHPGEGFVLQGPDGQVLAQAGTLDPAWWKIAPPAGETAEVFGVLKPRGGHRVRYVTLRFLPQTEGDERNEAAPQRQPLLLRVGRDAHDLDEKLEGLAWLLAGIFGLTAVLSAGIMAIIIRQGLQPLGNLARQISDLGQTDLTRRVSLAKPPGELQPVVTRLNELLGRLEASFARERAFTADVAHELRTPLAGLRAALQVSLAQPRTPAEYQRTLTSCLDVSGALAAMVENLLTMARADAKQIEPACAQVDLGALLADTWTPLARRAEARNLRVQWQVDSDLQGNTDRHLLAAVLRNLFDNAVTYVEDAGTISIAAWQEPAGMVLEITNTGSQVAETDAPHVLERFWRGDTARNTAGQHCGLGLALCRQIVELVGGTIGIRTNIGCNFLVLCPA